MFRGADECAIDHDQTSLEAGVLLRIVRAQDLQLADIPCIILAEMGIAFRSERLVIARPVFGCRVWLLGREPHWQ